MAQVEEMTPFQTMVLKELSDIKSTAARTEQKMDDLTGTYGRVTVIEKRLDTADNRMWVKVFVIGPILFAIHAALRRLGVQI